MSEAAVAFERVSKRFTIHHERTRSFQDLLVRGFRRSDTSEAFWALRDVSFDVEPGTALGIMLGLGGLDTLIVRPWVTSRARRKPVRSVMRVPMILALLMAAPLLVLALLALL